MGYDEDKESMEANPTLLEWLEAARTLVEVFKIVVERIESMKKAEDKRK